MVKIALCREIKQKVNFFEGSKTAMSLSSHNDFLLKFFGHGMTPGCGLKLSDDMPEKKYWFWFWVQRSTLFKKRLCSKIFIKIYFFLLKSDYVGHNSMMF